MHRRDLIRMLGGAAAVPALTGLSPERLLALSRDLHARAADGAGIPVTGKGDGSSAFRALDREQAETVAAIAELIIPETDTPGARAAGVPEFIHLIVAEWYGADERERFFEGLAGVDARSRTTFGGTFTSLAEEERRAVLRGLDAEVSALREVAAGREEAELAEAAEAAAAGRDVAALRAAADPEAEEIDPDDHFFAQMKWLTVYGYYTSEVGVNEELEYVMIPGRFDPCAPIASRAEPESG